MAIQMRNNTNLDSVCCECNEPRKNVLDMFDVRIGGKVFTLCDECTETLFNKTLKAISYRNAKVKSQHDIAIINKRKSKKHSKFGV